MKREVFLRSAGAALIAWSLSGCGNREPTPRPEPVPVSMPTSELYGTQYERALFDTGNFSPELMQTARELWLNGRDNNAVQQMTLRNGNSLFVSFAAATQQPVEFKSASTIIGTDVIENSDGHYMRLSLQGNFDPTAHTQFPSEIQEVLTEVDIAHESAILLSQLYYLTTGTKKMGFDFAKTFQAQGVPLPPTQEFLESYRAIRNDSLAYSEAIAELADFYLLKDIVDKKEDGSITFAVLDSQNKHGEWVKEITPVLNGIPYGDAGLFYITATTIAPSIHRYKSFDELMSAYANVTDIPGFDEYFSQIQEHFSR